jgi:DNA-3-methyladenine glycosylase
MAPAAASRLERRFFARPAPVVACDLVGKLLVRADDGLVARLVETEAYTEDEPACHGHRGMTRRNAPLFGPPGHAYVYFTYGMHWCANLVCGSDGQASAVLLRAGEVVEGVELARARRASARTDRDLARGPARLAAALGLSGADNGVDLLAGTESAIRLVAPTAPGNGAVRRGPRVGLAQAADRQWRFWLDGDPTVSPYRAHTPRRRARVGDVATRHPGGNT